MRLKLVRLSDLYESFALILILRSRRDDLGNLFRTSRMLTDYKYLA